MKDALKSYGADLAEQIVAKFESAEVRELMEQTKSASDGDTGTFEVVITTENLDRYSEVIKLDGWDLEHYRKNPIVLWGHDHSEPIGVATSIEITDGKMIAKGKFAPTAKAQEIRALYDAGIIRATSVGFLEKEREGNLITKAELLEFSFVSVPANPYALSLAMEKGLGINDLVTKGFMSVEKASEEAPEPETVVEETVVEEPVVERSFDTRALSPVIDSLRSALVALEALGIKAEEPEGDDEPEVENETEDEKAYRTFSEKRQIVQQAVTVLGDVLADTRQALRKKAA